MTLTARPRPRTTPNDPERSQEVQCGAHTFDSPVSIAKIIGSCHVEIVSASVAISGTEQAAQNA